MCRSDNPCPGIWAHRDSQRRSVARPAIAAPAMVSPARIRKRRSLSAQFRRRRRSSDGSALAGRSGAFSLHGKRRPARQLSIRHVRRAARRCVVRVHASSGTTGKPTVVGYTAKDIDTLVDLDGAVHPRFRRTFRRHRAHRLRLRALHRRPRRPLRRRAVRLHCDPDVGRTDREAGAAHLRLQAGHHHGDAVAICSQSPRNSHGRTRRTSAR